MKKMKKFICALLVVLTAMTMLSEPFQVPVQAAKAVTANKNYKKAPNIKKKGTYNVNSKSKETYIRFTAPKTANYTFTFSNFRDWNKSTSTSRNLGNVYVQSMRKKSLLGKIVKTNGGKQMFLTVCTKWWYESYEKGRKNSKPELAVLSSRYAKMKLKKGETVYFKSFWTGGKHQYSVKIK